jgi:4-amino-4-deoxy-L-arabinose transferase-like glycosyltransferase
MKFTNRQGLRLGLLVAILLLAFCIRLYRLGAESLWYDETVSVHLAGKDFQALVAHTARDIHPPGYYLLLNVWMRIAGGTDYSAAFLSLSLGLLLVALAYRLGAQVFGLCTGFFAALLVAISPYNVWYSQEVRMYTLGAVLGVVLLLLVIRLLSSEPESLPRWQHLVAYAATGALGLWVLYYFAFLLLAANLIVAGWWLVARRREPRGWSWMLRWLVAQGGVLLLYAPWIPAAWRQATAPPVPSWRSAAGLGEIVVETWSALGLGQSVDPARVWPALVWVAILFGLGLFYGRVMKRHHPRRSGLTWLLAGSVFLPVLLIYLASFVTPLYHVRYVFIFSTPFYVMLAAGLALLWRRWRPALWLGLAVLVVYSGISLYAYHTDPTYASDDHREATRFLTDRWRPGDAILVNAGYGYTALLAYWDGDPIAWRGRLGSDLPASAREGPVLMQTGMVDGDASLGWGDPQSDFYAVSKSDTQDALARLFASFDRVWVYRIYDTVTDPEGMIRDWLGEHGTQFEDQVFTGESRLRVQGFLAGRDPLSEAGQSHAAVLADGSLQLVASTLEETAEVGSALDLNLVWRVGSPSEDNAYLFAGLFDQDGTRWAQTDERPFEPLYPAREWAPGAEVRTPLRVLVPAGTPPGRYRLEVGWYHFVDGQPVWIAWTTGERYYLGEIDVTAPADWKNVARPSVAHELGVSIGEGVRLLGFNAPMLEGHPGESLPFELVWLAAKESPSQGLAVLKLGDDSGNTLTEISSAPVGGRLPFSAMEAGQVVRDPRTLTLPPEALPGTYTVAVGRRDPEGNWLPIRRGPFPLGSTYSLATIRVEGRSAETTLPDVAHYANLRFGVVARLVGYDLELRPGALELVLHWQALESTTANLKVFVHLVGDSGSSNILAQADIQPHIPTSVWVPGEYVSDRVRVDIPEHLSQEGTRLLVGLYDESTGERLLAFAADGSQVGDSLELQLNGLGP